MALVVVRSPICRPSSYSSITANSYRHICQCSCLHHQFQAKEQEPEHLQRCLYKIHLGQRKLVYTKSDRTGAGGDTHLVIYILYDCPHERILGNKNINSDILELMARNWKSTYFAVSEMFACLVSREVRHGFCWQMKTSYHVEMFDLELGLHER